MAITIKLLHVRVLGAAFVQLLPLLLLLSNNPVQVHAFQPTTLLPLQHQRIVQTRTFHFHSKPVQLQVPPPSVLLATKKDNDNDADENDNALPPFQPDPQQHHRPRRRRFAPRQFLRRCRRTLTIASVAVVTATFVGNNNNNQNGIFSRVQLLQPPLAAHASAPVMAMPKAEGRDPGSEALLEHERRMTAAAQKELQDNSAKARQIEATQGKAARQRFEKQVQEQKQQEAAEKAAGLVTLKRNLLRQGIDPDTDMEGNRQVILYEKGIDLGEVPGTPFHLEQELQRTAPKRSMAVQKKAHREALACMVQDMEHRIMVNSDDDDDAATAASVVDYFAKHQDKTMALMNLPTARVSALLQDYKTNMEQYGQITVPQPGEMPLKEKLALREQQQQQKKASTDPAAKKAAREQAKRIKAEQQAKAKAERERVKAEKKAERERAKAQARADKENAKRHKQAAKAATVVTTAGLEGQPQHQRATPTETAVEGTVVQRQETEEEDSDKPSFSSVATAPPTRAVTPSPSISPLSVITGVAVAGGGGYMFKVLSDKAAKDEDERQRQFRLLMGDGDDKDDTPTSSSSRPSGATSVLEDFESDTTSAKEESSKASTSSSSSSSSGSSSSGTFTPTKAEPVVEVPKKRRLSIKKMFGKKSDRVTDLNELVGEEAKAPEFATLLAKMLTFGAPGRFPAVEQLGDDDDMPMETFALEKAKKLLSEQREASGLELQESAEIFADVVNCMLIDIVDLASTSLKEKDDDVTVKSINIVVDFMNHAASLYDSVAAGIVIKPVTYGGDLSKGKLEQMYSTYAVSGMMTMFGSGASGEGESSMTDDFDKRVALLQDVFQISEKKAEGLMMKAVQKNMMEMLKNGKGMEGMEDMLGGAGGLGGFPGMGEDGEGPSPEQLKEMLSQLKEMKDAGSIPPEEFAAVRKQFKEAFGGSIDDIAKSASSDGELSETDVELLDLMKAIMED